MTTDDVVLRTPRRRGTPLTWVRGGGLSALVFALPLLVIFGVFSWLPIVRAVVMSFQETNLIDARRGWAATTSRRVRGPAAARRDRATRCGSRCSRCLRLPDPARRRGAHARGPAGEGPLLGAGLPAGRRAARGRGAALEVLLRPAARGRVQHDPRLGRARPVPVAAEHDVGDAVARAGGHVGGGRRHRDHLPGRADGRPARAVRRGRGRRRRRLAQGLARARCRSCAGSCSSR